jgi:lipid-A-disaccharide synthase
VIKENYDRVYTIIGFEEKLFRDAGILGSYVGNPTVEEIPETLNREQSRKDLGISESEKVLVLMPGSRPSELKRHLKLFLESANLIEKTSGPLRVLIPLAQTESPDGIKHKLDQWLIESKSGLKVSLHPGQAFTCLAAGDFGIIKSGTSTLEAGLIGLPHVVIYQVNAVSAFLFKKVIRYFGPVGLVNLAGLEREPCVESPRSFPELLGSNITPFLVAESVLNLISSGPLKEVRSAIENLKIKLKPHGSPSQTLAKELLMLVNSRK